MATDEIEDTIDIWAKADMISEIYWAIDDTENLGYIYSYSQVHYPLRLATLPMLIQNTRKPNRIESEKPSFILSTWPIDKCCVDVWI